MRWNWQVVNVVADAIAVIFGTVAFCQVILWSATGDALHLRVSVGPLLIAVAGVLLGRIAARLTKGSADAP